MIDLPLTRFGPGLQEHAAILPDALTGTWCELTLRGLPTEPCRLALLLYSAEEDPSFPLVLAPRPNGTVRTVLYVPQGTRRLRIELFGADASDAMRLFARPLARPHAALKLLAHARRRVLRAAAGSPSGIGRRLRTALVQGDDEEVSRSYELWRRLFDVWPDSPDGFQWDSETGVHLLIYAHGGGGSEAARATVASLDAQLRPASFTFLTADDPLRPALAGVTAPYIGVLQAGEVLVPHAVAFAGAWLMREGNASALCADEDAIGPAEERHSPVFKPEPNRMLMLSGTLTRGLWLFRRDWVLAHAPERAEWAETLRLDLWLRLFETGVAADTRRIPFVLTSRRNDAEAAPPAALTAVVQAHSERVGQEAEIAAGAGLPLHVRPLLPRIAERRVTLVIPSALRAPHVRRCVRAVMEGTDHAALDALLVVSQPGPLTEAQQQTLDAIGAERRLRVLNLPVERFNYARANNEAVRRTDAEFVCLLNDDVAPVRAGWLEAMLGHFADPGVAAVGARLLYPNGQVQHGGILMGMGGLADHAHRFLDGTKPGYGGRAVLNQEVSAVTGACLLVRRAAYEAVGGMDEEYPIAFNDVDFCLRLREAGHRIVYCADAELIHHESLSLGHHFSGERAALQGIEVRRMRQRWVEVVAADPFHNPNLSLAPGAEWALAFPPRVRQAGYLVSRTPETPPPG